MSSRIRRSLRTLIQAKEPNYKIMNIMQYLAQTDLATGLGKILGIFQGLAMVIMVASLVIAGVSVTTGRMEAVKHGVIGAALAALAWVLVKTLFGSVGGTVIDVTPQSF